MGSPLFRLIFPTGTPGTSCADHHSLFHDHFPAQRCLRPYLRRAWQDRRTCEFAVFSRNAEGSSRAGPFNFRTISYPKCYFELCRGRSGGNSQNCSSCGRVRNLVLTFDDPCALREMMRNAGGLLWALPFPAAVEELHSDILEIFFSNGHVALRSIAWR